MQTNETTNARPTLAAMYDDLRARDEAAAREAQQQQYRDWEKENARHMTELSEWINARLSENMRAALDLSQPYWDGKMDTYDTTEQWYFTATQVTFTTRDVEWTIVQTNDGHTCLRAPEGYERDLTWNKTVDDAILYAIAEYPDWREAKRKARAEERAANDEEAAPAQPPEPRPALYCVGTSDRAFLRDGREVIVSIAMGGDIRGTVADTDKQWILLTQEDGEQILINRQHILTVALAESTSTLAPRASASSIPPTPDDQIPF